MRENVRGTMGLAHVAICFRCGRTELRNTTKALPGGVTQYVTRTSALRSFKKAGWWKDADGMLHCADRLCRQMRER